MSDYFGSLNKDQAGTVGVTSAPTMQLGDSARKAVGHLGKNNSWLDAYGQNDQKSWSDYYKQYREAFQADAPGGYQSPGSSGTDGDRLTRRYMDNIHSRDMEAQRKAMNTWMQDYWGKQAERDQQFFDFMQQNNEQGPLPGDQGGIYSDISNWANNTGYGDRTDWTPQEWDKAFGSHWRDPYMEAGNHGVPGYEDHKVYQDMATWANDTNYGGRTDWTRQELHDAWSGTGKDPRDTARELGIPGYDGVTPAPTPDEQPTRQPDVYDYLVMYANEFGEFENRKDWTRDQAQALFEGSGRDPREVATQLGIPGFHTTTRPMQENPLVGSISDGAVVGKLLDWAHANGLPDWSRQDVMNYLQKNNRDPHELARELGI